jgi:hypothetical protein
MRRAFVALAVSTICIVLFVGCDGPTEPHDDIDRALLAWNEMNARDYTFEVATQYSMFPRRGFYRVRVENRQVLEVFDENGAPVQGFNLTVQTIWNDILRARTDGEVNSARFDRLGVPVEINLGPWELDGGRLYSVRSFSRLR